MNRALPLALLLSSCIPHREELARAMVGARDVVTVAAPCLASVKVAELEACASDAACLEAARARWAQLADALDAFRAAWCLLSPESEGCS